MHTSAVHNASKLTTDERHLLEKLLGRTLGENELVEVNARGGRIIKEAATGAEREAVVRQMHELLARVDERPAAELSEEEFDVIMEEAIAHARRHR